MQSYQGKSVYKGIAMGPVVVLKKNDYQVKRTRIEDPEAEIKRVDEALEKSKEQLQKLYDKAVQEVGEASAAIFEVHQMMLEDDDYLEAIQNTIRTEQINAEYAVAATGDNFAEMFASIDDSYESNECYKGRNTEDCNLTKLNKIVFILFCHSLFIYFILKITNFTKIFME